MSKSKKQSPPKRKPRAAFSVAEIDQLCAEYCLRKNLALAAESLGIPYRSAKKIKADRRWAERFPLVREKLTNKIVDKAAEKFSLRVEDIDRSMFDMLTQGFTHEYRGDSDRVKCGEVLYKRMKLIDPPRITASSTALSAAGAAMVAGQNAFQVYESKWLTQKKEQWAQELEAKHGNNAPTTPSE